MKGFIQGIALGGAITAAALMGYAYGNEDGQAGAYADAESTCQVAVGFGRITAGTECLFDQVMTGYRNEYLLCADVRVTCPDR